MHHELVDAGALLVRRVHGELERCEDRDRAVALAADRSMTPPNLDALRAIPDPADRAIAAGVYIAEREEAIRVARQIRDEAIASLIESGGDPTDIAVRVGVSPSKVKLVRLVRDASRQ